jgi:hypothetical protein
VEVLLKVCKLASVPMVALVWDKVLLTLAALPQDKLQVCLPLRTWALV